MSALVESRSLSRVYQRDRQRIEVLHHINLDVEPGDFVVLMGRSGSGKTTLLNLIGGLDSRCMATRTACTCPCGRERTTSKSSSTGRTATPASTARIPSICSSESAERLASVRLRTFFPTRYDSRSRYVGLELRFGTASICMAT